MTNDVEALKEGLKNCARLFRNIRMDWSDPRYDCRAGIDLVKDLVGWSVWDEPIKKDEDEDI